MPSNANKPDPITAGLSALWDAGLSDWQRHADPDAALAEIRGETVSDDVKPLTPDVHLSPPKGPDT